MVRRVASDAPPWLYEEHAMAELPEARRLLKIDPLEEGDHLALRSPRRGASSPSAPTCRVRGR